MSTQRIDLAPKVGVENMKAKAQIDFENIVNDLESLLSDEMGVEEEKGVGRFISRTEALRIAREILEMAERERLVFAEYEAARGIQLENHPTPPAPAHPSCLPQTPPSR